MNTYIIICNIILTCGILFDKEFRVKNKCNELDATTSFESYLKRKHGDKFLKLEVISCKEENFLKSFFGGFGNNNPFRF